LRRNSLSTTLSKVVVPVEFPNKKSGTGGTILHAKKQNTPIVGILPKHNKALKSTKLNFIDEKIDYYEFDSNFEQLLIKVFSIYFSDHDWSDNPKVRQERFFKVLVKRVMQ